MIKTINVDRVVRRKDYEGNQGLVVTSMFRTLQGEGPYSGHPSVFLRLSGCNFGDKDDHCRFCDTKFHLDDGKLYEFPELLAELCALPGYNRSDILVVTGGEPTLQEQLLSFMAYASGSFRKIQVETNGTQAYFFKQLSLESGISLVVSPKASHKLGGYAKLSDTVLEKATCLKFVIDADEASPNHCVPDWALNEAKKGLPVYVSPIAVYKRAPDSEVASIWDDTLINRVDTAANYAYAAHYAMKHHLLLSLQTHLFTAVP